MSFYQDLCGSNSLVLNGKVNSYRVWLNMSDMVNRLGKFTMSLNVRDGLCYSTTAVMQKRLLLSTLSFSDTAVKDICVSLL